MTKLKKKESQRTRFYNFLTDKVASCTDACVVLDIPQKNLTRYKKEFEAAGLLQAVKVVKCPHTRKWVQGISTDPDKFPKYVQLSIFS